ncbi:substrate-binding periplasmic protein [Thalassotalea marina]|uniref:ABC transporter substrate-binding protein n=1 Tax=Thalassotalea marina TaxID=1673741 RepID=A0A919ENR2_9GAMM|nr:transporter substrate-binding domain-containing protein [Thalassotalea marina]GHG03338.1 ABC transporter substrate-binding protein [Thalassotalea marina]
MQLTDLRQKSRVKHLLCVLITCCATFKLFANEYYFASIDHLGEQQVAQRVLPQIYAQLGHNIHITPLAANRAQYEANSGLKDGEILRIFSYGKENPNVIRVPTPYYSLSTAVFVLAGADIKINSVADLKGYRIGRVRGVKHTLNATKNIEKVYDSNNTKQLFLQLIVGNIDIALTNHQDGLMTLKELNVDSIQLINKSIADEPLYHYLHRKNIDLVTPVDNQIKAMKQSGELQQLIDEAELAVY